MSLEELIDAEATTQKPQKRNDTDGPTKKWPIGSRGTRLKLSYQIFFGGGKWILLRQIKKIFLNSKARI